MGKNYKKKAFGLTPSDRRYKLRYARYVGLADAVASYLGKQAGENGRLELLDVGCGRGRTYQYLEGRGIADRFTFHGLDVDFSRPAKIYGKDVWNFIEADVTEGLPFPDERFDVVVCEQILEHLGDPLFVLKEAGRVLKKGGLLVLGTPIFPPGAAALRKHLVPVLDKVFRVHRDHVQFFTLSSIRDLVRQCGLFEVRGEKGFRIMSGGLLAPLENFHWWWRYNMFLGRKLPAWCTEIQILAFKRGE
jgi:SAM-dependent methyltransferase